MSQITTVVFKIVKHLEIKLATFYLNKIIFNKIYFLDLIFIKCTV